MNKVILIGNLSNDFELRYLNTGTAVGNASLAVNRSFTRQDGTKDNEAMFIDLSLFGRTAEVCNQYLKKGSKICVEGYLSLQQWQDKSGNKKSKHVVIVEKVEFLHTKSETQAQKPAQVAQPQMQVQTIQVQDLQNQNAQQQNQNSEIPF